MNKEEYVVATDETAIYPEAGTGSVGEIMYLTLGLIGEIAELEGCHTTEKTLAELGDCYWYLFRLERVFAKVIVSTELSAAYKLEWEKVYLGGDYGDGMFPFLLNKRLLTDCSALANVVKKFFRDGMQYDRVMKGLILVRKIEYFLDKMLTKDWIDEPKGYVLYLNIAKLRSRKERNVLGGDGDNR
jgi:hypothetical protein